MGGNIWVESEEGKGTQFHFTMVLNSVEDKPTEYVLPDFVRKSLLSNRQCLVIEHSPIVRDLLHRDVEVFGLNGITVPDFTVALASLRSNQFAVIIVDGSLSGCEAFINKVTEIDSSLRLIVTAILGRVAEFEDGKIVATLAKPIRRWRLFKALEAALSGEPIVTASDADLIAPMDRQRLANLAYRHPLRILVFFS